MGATIIVMRTATAWSCTAARRTLAHCGILLVSVRHVCKQVVTAWNGMTIGALANAGRVLEGSPSQRLFPVEGRPARDYLAGALEVAGSGCA